MNSPQLERVFLCGLHANYIERELDYVIRGPSVIRPLRRSVRVHGGIAGEIAGWAIG